MTPFLNNNLYEYIMNIQMNSIVNRIVKKSKPAARTDYIGVVTTINLIGQQVLLQSVSGAVR